ncbi:MAG: T9SS type A sorting domain-containing protein [Flavobacteriales bacterium]|tara:strand:+ start:1913 stop:3775 length:1863 start_codon:yes stop_codon:yes gene_type:complete
MKNFYSIICLLIIANTSFAQIMNNQNFIDASRFDQHTKYLNKYEITLRSSVDCSTSDALYCEDFENVSIPDLPSDVSTSTLEQNYYTISNSDQVLVTGFYTGTSADANAGGYWPVGEHGQFAMTNDDACRPGGVTPGNNNNCDLGFETLTLPILDFTGQFDVFLIFDYYHDKNYGGGDANVEVSNDGGVSFTDISGPLPNLEAWQQGIFSLSDYNDQDSIVIRFVWSDAGSWATGLAIDDIEINELQDNSLSMPLFNQWLAGYDGFASSYSQIPLSMIPNSTGIIFQSYVFNNGNFAQDSIRLHASATGFTSQSTAVNLESLEQDTLQCSERFQPTSTGTYQLDFYLMSDSVTTATKSKSIEITDYIYARDDNEIDAVNSLLPSGDGVSSWERGTIYDIYESNTLYAIDVYVHNRTTANAKIQGKIYLYQDDQSFFLEETNLLSITASDEWQSVKFANPVTLDAESQYLITVGGDGSALNDTLRIGSSGSVQSSYGYIVYNGWVDDNGTTATDGTTGSTPMVRMNMNPNVPGPTSIEDDSYSAFNVYPNPNNGILNISLTNSTDKQTIEIKNIIGQTVYSQIAGNSSTTTINLSDINKGIYTVSLINENGTSSTKKIIIQ